MAIGEVLGATALFLGACSATPFVAELLRPPRPVGSVPDAPGRVVGEPGRRTFYRWTGPSDGPVAVCVHGLTTPSYVWDAFAEQLAERGYRVLTYDLYGRGFSDCPNALQSGQFFARQLDDLLTALQVEGSVLLFGYSMGGAVAAAFAATFPERVNRLVLIAPAGFGHDLGPVTRLATLVPLLGGMIMRLAYPAESRRGLEQDRALPCVIDNMIERQIEETHWRGFAPVVWSSLHGILSEDFEPIHRHIAQSGIPTLAIWGGSDEVIPITGMARLQDWNPNARHEVISDAGHALTYTQTDDLSRAFDRLMTPDVTPQEDV